MKTITLLIAASLFHATVPDCPPTSPEDLQKICAKPDNPILPPPFETPSANQRSQVIGWPTNLTPSAPSGFVVTKMADKLNNPRWLYVADNDDVFLSQGTGGNDILLLRDTNNTGKFDQRITFLSGQNRPFGMLILNNYFYVANTDGVWRYPYQIGQTQLSANSGAKILDLPAGGYNNHWTRNLLASKDGSKIYVTVGSGSNVAEHGVENEVRRANILQINPDGTNEKIFASGLRNPVGLDWAPSDFSTLWTAVNERDGLGDDLVPDYMTSLKEGGFYGWPYSYIGQHVDPRINPQCPSLIAKTIVPDLLLGSHTASLGLVFYKGSAFPTNFRQGAFVSQHGSWNRAQLVGYKVIFVPFENGKPSGEPKDFLYGFVADYQNKKVYGRPVGLAVWKGALLVTDDASDIIWKVAVQ